MTDGIRPAGIEFARIVNGFAVLLSALAPALVLGYDDTEQQALAAAISFLMVATPVAVGIYAQRSEGTRRFGRQLVLVGCGLFVTTLGHSDSDLLYTVARIDGWLMEVAIIYVLCAYPTGRLTERAERFTVAAAAILIAALYLPTIPVAEFPAPSPWSTCTADCPSNAFMSGGSTPALVADVIQPLRGLLAALVFLSAALALARRVRRASPLARTSLTPVLGVAIIRFSAEAGFILLRATDLPDDVVATVAMVINLTIPIVAAGFLVGLLRWRLRVARALEGLYGRLGTATDPGGLQTMLRECLEDPELRIYLPEPGRPRHWRDAAGAPYDAEVEGRPGRSLSEVDAGGGLTALVCCDVAISEQRSLLEGVSRTVASFLEHDRLTRALES